ncbi:MAG: DUF1553 domain-containing protein [Rubripirellula sp.]|nr:DUF1553 domain-containing protein [Rubripirellula sp.]
MFRFLVCLLGVLSANWIGTAQELSRQQRDLFEIHVRPLLVTKCLNCHSSAKQEGRLSLTTREDLLRGGESGPAIVPGKPEQSLLLEALRYESLEMPPDGQVKASQIAGISQWIAAGAPWPAKTVLQPSAATSNADADWWCYQPLVDPEIPPIDSDSWSRTELDQFILRRLLDAGLTPAEEADPIMLVRRLSFAVLGLPPDQDTIDAALSESFDIDAYVDRLLDSDEYGRNQARFWLDLVRYADSDGYRADFDRPKARQYRDYVIKSFNHDKPYDRFIIEQLAGDEIDPGNRDAVVATMYLRHWIYEHNQRDVETQWHEILSDITETTSDVFLAQGLKCARCHDHKFDPLLQKDFFRLKAFFAAFQPTEAHPVATLSELTEYRKQQANWEDATREIRRRLREIEHPVLLQHATREGFEKFIPKIKQMIQRWPDDRTPYEQQIASLAARQYDLPRDEVDKWLTEEQQQERQQLQQQLAEFEKLKPEPLPTMEFVASDIGSVAPETFIPDDPSQTPIAPGFLTLFAAEPADIIPPPAALQSTGRRTALANWIASPDNPLTARVIVNRIWQQHFGRGLVETASDFGHLGTPPSHPELLDWLALKFIEDGWSLKKLHRRILTSATYRQTSLRSLDDQLIRIDPDNALLWRMKPRRLSGEEINDAILATSGELPNLKRAIYKPVKRNTPDPLLAAFDGPDRIRSMGLRHQTTTSKQALLMGNSDWTHDRARAIAARIPSQHGEPSQWITNLYRTLFARIPVAAEVDLATNFLQRYQEQTPSEEPPEVRTLAEMPGTKSNAVLLSPENPITLQLAAEQAPPSGDLTIEAVILLRSLYPDASVRTIVAQWNGKKSNPGWSLGVTSTKSAYQPRNFILQLIGNQNEGDALHYEVIASGLRPELDKPYYLAVAIDLDDTTENGITFYLKDLSKADAKLQTAKGKHSVTRGITGNSDLTIGGRQSSHQWDGLIDSIRIEPMARDLTVVAQADSEQGLPAYAVDWQFEDSEQLGKDDSGNGHHAVANIKLPDIPTPADRAKVALIHALLNSNEFIYVD